MHELPQVITREGTYMIGYIYYAHLASVRFEHSVCRESLMTTYMTTYMTCFVFICPGNLLEFSL